MFKICFYIPIDHAEKVKKAIFAAGAGKVGEYESCAWQVLGEGQFKPLTGARPFVGKENQIEKIVELKIEMVCEAKYIHAAIAALKTFHPYEEPAYQVIRLEIF